MPKAFAANNQELGRMYMDAVIDDRTLREIYLRGFEIGKTAKPWTVMCAYNRLNGVYCSEHDWLLNTVLREEWGFEGWLTDWGAANDRPRGVKAGLDLEMPGSGVNNALVVQAVANDDLDEAVIVLARNIALSLSSFNRQRPATPADPDDQHRLARKAAAQSCVLLKNEKQLLPLSNRSKIVLIGAFADKPRFQGAGSSQVRPTQVDTLRQALTAYLGNMDYAQGYEPVASRYDQTLITEAVALAKRADVTVVYAGLPGIFESEGFDREHLDLPDQHNALITASAPPIPIQLWSLPMAHPSMPWIDQVPAVIEGYLKSQWQRFDALMGVQNPAGKLAETFPLKLKDVPCLLSFPARGDKCSIREGVYVGYRYYDTA